MGSKWARSLLRRSVVFQSPGGQQEGALGLRIGAFACRRSAVLSPRRAAHVRIGPRRGANGTYRKDVALEKGVFEPCEKSWFASEKWVKG